MFSTLTERGAAITLEALSLGADDYVPKVSNEGSLDRSLLRLREQLVPKIRQFFLTPGEGERPKREQERPEATRPVRTNGSGARPRAVVVGVSTGGPAALAAILPEFPADFPLPVLIVQHMPPLFTRLLAERLHRICALGVSEGSSGEPVGAGKIWIAPGDFHMKVIGRNGAERLLLDQLPPQNSCRPAADALFASAAEIYGGAVVAAVLTGMGQDGLNGARLLRARGATVLAQDEATSVVWGMPGSVTSAGLADRVLPLDQIVPEILRLAHGG
jgi:two-component system chemotaxis response regulator CheB